MQNLSDQDLEFIAKAAEFLENDSLTQKIIGVVGKPLEIAQDKLPDKVKDTISVSVEKALHSALKVVIGTVQYPKSVELSLEQRKTLSAKHSLLHTVSSSVSGAVGGFFGPISLPVELPVSTSIMLRGISSIAQDWGFALHDPKVQLECLYVFTLGSKHSKKDDGTDSTYFTSRVGFSEIMRQTASFMAKSSSKELLSSIETGSAPIVLRFIAKVATYFEIIVTEKVMAEALPLVGALGGGAINALFSDFFMSAARYHFGLLHLEETYGHDAVEVAYNGLRPRSAQGYLQRESFESGSLL